MKKWLIIIIFTAVLLRIGFIFSVPDWWAPDEYPHYFYIEKILTDKKLPISKPEFPEYECYQPPLYYIFSALILKLTGAKKIPFFIESLEKPERSFSYNIIILRIISVILSFINLIFLYLIVKKVFKGDNFSKIICLAFFAFLPSFVSNSFSITNDVLSNLIGTILIFLLLKERTFRNDTLLGLFSGLGIIIKPNLLVFFPIIIIFLIGKSNNLTGFIKSFLLILSISLLISIAYFLRNYNIYGTPVAINPGVEVSFNIFNKGFNSVHRVLRNSFWSFWAAFGRIYEFKLNKFIYLFYFFPITLIAIYGIIKCIANKIEETIQNNLTFWIIAVTIFIGSSIGYSLVYEINCSWGKYFFPVLPLISILFIAGLKITLKKYYRLVSIIFVISLVLIDIKFLIEFILC
ncbi:hypothetical protein DRQ09_05785 [candidate division KSB1 bacterium]|nr:MAG: hypothetical protein DRQ09_05785 [candidate division KSB1 bacterium]